MARPTKQGIDYFPLDTQFDDKIELYLIETESTGLAVLITLWQIIFQNEGYYIQNNEDLPLLIKRRINVDINAINVCINVLLKRNVFSNDLNDKYGILTSKAIQKRYFEASKRKKYVHFNGQYLLDGINVNINAINVNINGVSVDINATNVKGKEKVNINREGEEHPDTIQILWIKTFGRNPKFLEREETENFIKKFGEEKTESIFRDAVKMNFHSVFTLAKQIDENGNIKPREKNYASTKTSTRKYGYEYSEEKAKQRLEELRQMDS